MNTELTYKYYRKLNSKTVYLVLHGAGTGIEGVFISGIIHLLVAKGDSVFGFNFPYCERGEDNSSGEELTEETAALEDVVQYLRGEGYEKIVIVAKSLGGITTSYWLEQHPASDVEAVVLGYVLGSVKTAALAANLRAVIQGENDRFGNAAAVEEELAASSISASVIEVPQADHSYRNAQKEPIYQDQAIELLLQTL